MNWTKIAFVVAAGGALVYLLKKVGSNVSVNFAGLKWLGLNGLKLKWALKYSVHNANDIPVTVSKFKGTLYFGTYKLNDVLIDKEITVQPGSDENLEVNFSMSAGSVLAEILRFIEEKSGLKKFILKGTMTGKLGDVPWIYPINETLSIAS